MVALERWTRTNNMKVNTGKTKIVKFRNGEPLAKKDKHQFEGSWIVMVNEFNYLGMTFQTKLGFSKHIMKVKAKTSTATALMTKYLHKISLESAMKIFKAKVEPTVTVYK